MTEGVLSVAAMQADDMPEVLRIEQACYDFPWSEDLMFNCLKVGYHALVLRESERIRGYAFASGAAGESHILNICVDPDHRGQGHARTLVSQCIATVMVHGAKVIFLEVRESNIAAIALYESMGFVEIGRRNNYYRCKPRATAKSSKHRGVSKHRAVNREDALVMSRDLTIISDTEDI